MFIQVSLTVLGNGIESLHISMSLVNNNSVISMLSLSTGPFLICISVLQYKLAAIIYST